MMCSPVRSRVWQFGLACLLVASSAVPARAGTILGFDDLGPGIIGDIGHYGGLGFQWTGIGSFNTAPYIGNGYSKALVSPDNVAYSSVDTNAGFHTVAGTLFTFNSGYFASGFNDGLTIDVQGLKGGSTLYSTTLVLNTTNQTFATFNYANIDEVKFVVTAPGTLNTHLPYSGFGSQFGMDDLTFNDPTVSAVPVPPASAMAVIGMGSLSCFGFFRRRVSRATS